MEADRVVPAEILMCLLRNENEAKLRPLKTTSVACQKLKISDWDESYDALVGNHLFQCFR